MDSVTFVGGVLGDREMTVAELEAMGAGIVVPANGSLHWFVIKRDGTAQHRLTSDLVVIEREAATPLGVIENLVIA